VREQEFVGASLRGRPFFRQAGAPTEWRPYNFVKLGHYLQDLGIDSIPY
jgi:hypothetical protein